MTVFEEGHETSETKEDQTVSVSLSRMLLDQ